MSLIAVPILFRRLPEHKTTTLQGVADKAKLTAPPRHLGGIYGNIAAHGSATATSGTQSMVDWKR